METVLWDGCVSSVCRLCLGIFPNKPSDDGCINVSQLLSQKIFDCTSIEIIESDGLPPNICVDCCQEVERMYSFRIRCLSSDVILRNHFLIGSKPVKVENEAATDDSGSTCDFVPLSDTNQLEDVTMEEDVDIQPPTSESTPFQDLHENELVTAKLGSVNKETRKRGTGHDVNYFKRNSKPQIQSNSQPASQSTHNTLFASTSTVSEKSNLLSINKKPQHRINRTAKRKPRFFCHHCKKGFKHRYSLNRHSVCHIGEPMKCEHCNKSFSNPESFRRHGKIHSGQKPYTCHICDKSYMSGTSYAAHVRKHTGERPYQCTECKESFYRLSSLDRHAAKHRGVRKYICEVCTASFWVADDLRAHVNRVH